MKKLFCIGFSIAFCLSIASCGSSSPLDTIEGANSSQKEAIQSVLDECGIEVTSCEAVSLDNSGNELEDAVKGALMTSYDPYEITDGDGNTYRLVIDVEDYSVFSITDENGEFVYGGIAGLFK